MERHGSCVRLRPERREEYLRLHAAVWPEVEQTLVAAGIRNYAIFLHDDLLFSYYEYAGPDHASAQAQIAADPATRRWWALTDPCQERLPGTPEGEQWLPLPEVWHLTAGGRPPEPPPRAQEHRERAMPVLTTPVLDAHVHLWDTERLRYPWLDEVPLPRRVDAAALTAAADPVAEFVLVQADCAAEQALAEIAWLSEQAALLRASAASSGTPRCTTRSPPRLTCASCAGSRSWSGSGG